MTIPSFPPIFHHCSMIILSSSIIIPSSSILAGMRFPIFQRDPVASCQGMHGQRLSADISALSMALGEAEQRGLQEIWKCRCFMVFYGVLWFVNLPIGWLNMENIWENDVLIMLNFMVLLWVKQCHKPSLKSIQITKNRWYGYHSQSWMVMTLVCCFTHISKPPFRMAEHLGTWCSNQILAVGITYFFRQNDVSGIKQLPFE